MVSFAISKSVCLHFTPNNGDGHLDASTVSRYVIDTTIRCSWGSFHLKHTDMNPFFVLFVEEITTLSHPSHSVL